MKSNEKNRWFIESINSISSVLPVFFWLFLIFGFDEPGMALSTIFAAIIHESGHLLSIKTKKKLNSNIRGVISGFRIKTVSPISYDDEIKIYLAGPIANLVAFVILLFLSTLFGDNLIISSIINLATALSNLLPIEGYDGYNALMTLIKKYELDERFSVALFTASSACIFLFAVFSLYFIDRANGGYWIFLIFFSSMIKCIKKSLVEQFGRF